MRGLVLAGALTMPALAGAQVDPRCADLPRPADYDEQVQQDFLANYVALATTLSPLHGPLPHQPGHGAIGVEVAVVPPLSCARRYVLGWTKTEETNKAPAVPRLRASVALPAVGPVVPWLGAAYLPPVPVNGTRNVVLSGELGAGMVVHRSLQVGLRLHATLHKTVADVATAFDPSDPPVDDLYLASTLGVDGMLGLELGALVPYLAVGFTDVSTAFYVGDDGVMVNNLHPYAGPTLSLGVDGLVRWFRWGAELYAAPGGHSLPHPDATTQPGFGRYGHLLTGRLRVAVEL